MTDFADTASDTEQMFLDIAIRHHAQRCQRPEPLPLCAHCEESEVYILSNGARCQWCLDCRTELMMEGKK
jgi:hypothetical protein